VVAARLLDLLVVQGLARVQVLALERVRWTPRAEELAEVKVAEEVVRVAAEGVAEEVEAEEEEPQPPHLEALLKAWPKLIAARWAALLVLC
jgi:hypothetical protein